MKKQSNLTALREAIRRHSNATKARFLEKYFQVFPGGYGQGDRFLGLTVPQVRVLVRQFPVTDWAHLKLLIRSQIHEERLAALLNLVREFNRRDTTKADRAHLYQFYVRHFNWINNWDLIDGSAGPIVGGFLWGKNLSPLEKWANSPRIWTRRVAIMATFEFIKRGKFGPTLNIAQILLRDEHDLIHKAVGWMLREVGNRDPAQEEGFLKKYYRQMPRIMLRYAIEKFPEPRRQAYLKGVVRSRF